MAEDFGVEGRGKFYEEVGTLRDVIENHLFQTAGLLAMEPPVGPGVEELRDGKEHVFAAMETLKPDDLVRGQFEGYRDEDGVAPDSDVETFAAVRLHIDSWRWAGVPFYVRARARSCRSRLHRGARRAAPTADERVLASTSTCRLRRQLLPLPAQRLRLAIAAGVRVKARGRRLLGRERRALPVQRPPG